MDKTIDDYQNEIKSLERLLQLYHFGKRESYKKIAIKLRKLLCYNEDTAEPPLLPQVFPDLKLHPLYWTKKYTEYPEFFSPPNWFLPGRMSFDDSGEFHFELLLDTICERLPLNIWVKQPFISSEITIDEFIKMQAKAADIATRPLNPAHKKNVNLMITSDYEEKLLIAIAEYITGF